MRVLGIETSCDETAVAIVQNDKKILYHQVYSQIKAHQHFGGVVPEISARAHLKILPQMIQQALEESGIKWEDINAVAATSGPGLIGGVLVGVMTAKAIALARGIPYIAVNHLAAHALTVRLTENIDYPYLMLLVSGGHCQMIYVKSATDFNYLGGTIDDAVGECFDKTARALGLAYPGGPKIEQMAFGGNAHAYNLPASFKGITDGPKAFQFSFSGLKSAVKRIIDQAGTLSEMQKSDIAASLQYAIGQILVDRCQNALRYCIKNGYKMQGFVVAGGVAANQYLRDKLENLTKEFNVPFYAPPPALCTDNGVMVAWTGIELLQQGISHSLDFKPRPRWPLEDIKNYA